REYYQACGSGMVEEIKIWKFITSDRIESRRHNPVEILANIPPTPIRKWSVGNGPQKHTPAIQMEKLPIRSQSPRSLLPNHRASLVRLKKNQTPFHHRFFFHRSRHPLLP
ncbi:MAG: hypothetical protein ACO3RV_09540, partial [Luteolibacter sp.]